MNSENLLLLNCPFIEMSGKTFYINEGRAFYLMHSKHVCCTCSVNDVICNISIYADDTTLYSTCDQASDLWQQLELACELGIDL